MAELKIFQTPQDVANEFAAYFSGLANTYFNNGQKLHVALSGGSTPKIWFETLLRDYKDQIPWSHTCFYWGDERMVPPESEESNYGVAKRILFDHIHIPEENIFPVIGTNDIAVEIERYSGVLRKNLKKNGICPVFDLQVLGMGDDGHTASIFPHQMELLKSEKICEKASHPESGQIRLTLSGKVLNSSKRVVFLVTGDNKKEKLKQVFEGGAGSTQYPSSFILPESGELLFLVDRAAASLIGKG